MSSQLQNKLLHYELIPPSKVWSEIAASLDKKITFSFSEKIYQFEEVPPPSVWEKINSSLDNDAKQKNKVVPFFFHYRKPLKYAAAIVLFVFLGVLATLFISKKTVSETPFQMATKKADYIKADSTEPKKQSKETYSTVQLTPGTKIRQETKPFRKNYFRSAAKKISASVSSVDNFFEKGKQQNELVSSLATANKYMTYTNSDGNEIRLPRKMFAFFACPPGDIACALKIKLLQKKIASSVFSSDFSGILEILNVLKEN